MDFLNDLRFAWRGLLRSPGFTLAAVVTLAVGIGANTAMFSVVRTVLLSPLPYQDSERLVHLQSQGTEPGSSVFNVNPLDLADWAREARDAFETIEGVNYRRFVVRGGEGEPERLRGARANAGFFSMLGVQPALGRSFEASEDVPGSPDVVVISHDLWQQRFGGRDSALGESLEINGSPHEVLGVLPAGFRSPLVPRENEPQVWVPLRIQESMGRGGLWLVGIGRLKADVPLESARQELAAMAAAMEEQYPHTNEERGVRVSFLKESMVGDLEQPLLFLFAAVALVLLIACVNVANLLLARAASRQRELTVRTVLGAGAGRLARQVVTESLLLALLGSALGLLLALAINRWLTLLGAGQIPRLEELSIDSTVLFFTLFLALLTGVAFGLIPAWRSTRIDLRSGLAEGGRSDASGGRRLPMALVVAEMALALMLLIVSGLLLRSFGELLAVDVGFDPQGVATLEISLPGDNYEPPQRRDFYLRLIEEVKSLPGVVSASAVDLLPFSGYYSCSDIAVADGSSPEASERVPCAEYRVVADDYFSTLDIEVLEGRALQASDGAEGLPVVVVNETLARRLWPEGSALDHILTLSFAEAVDHQIVGVVENVHHFGLDAEVQPELYVSHRQQPGGWMTLVARSEGDPASLAPLLRNRVHELDPNLALNAPGSLAASISDSVASPRLRTVLLTCFAGIALFLAAVGMFGVLAYSVARRTQEIGVRMALGARGEDVLGMVVRQSMSAALLGVVLGLAGAFASTRLAEGLFYGITATDPWTFVLGPLVLLLVALGASVLPALRASRIEPQIALRDG